MTTTDDRSQGVSLDQAKAELRALAQEYAPTGWQVEIHYWHFPLAGPRIAEITYIRRGTDGTAGCSFLQSDPSCFALLFAAERYLVDRMLGEANGGFSRESEYALRQMLQPPEAAVRSQ